MIPIHGWPAAVLRRLATTVVVIWGEATLAFVALAVLPGDPVNSVLGTRSAASPAVRQHVVEQFGFDKPLPEQYLMYLGRLLHGDLGLSYQLQQPVASVIASQLGPTLQLTGAAVLIAVVLSVVLTVLTSGRGRWAGRVSGSAEIVLLSTPSFFLGVLLLNVFSFRFHLFPVSGDDSLRALVLPALTLALPITALLTQVMRRGLQDVLEAPFVVSARARGSSEASVRGAHALRHAALPALTLLGWAIGSLISAAVIVENVFARPGIGRLALQAVNTHDMPVVMGTVMLSALVYVVVNAVVDLTYLAVDPRLRRSSTVVAR